MQVAGIDWAALVAENVVPGLVAVVLTGALVRGWHRLQDAYVERQYPITGTYISKFRDANAQNRDSDIYQDTESYTAIAELDQRGTTITGSSRTDYRTFSASWSLEGEITDDGYLVGQYAATHPHDQGHGTFFLYIRKNRQLRGIWAGYEDEGGEINHGEYVFRPVLDVSTGPLRDASRPAAVALLESAGADDVTVEKVTRSDDRRGFTLVANADGGTPGRVRRLVRSALERAGVAPAAPEGRTDSERGFVGTVVATVSEGEAIDTALRPDRTLPAAVSCATTVGVIDYVAVAEQYRDRGVGTQLVRAALDRLDDEGVEVVCLLAEGRERAAIDGVMNALGFEEHPLPEREESEDGADSSQSLYVTYRC
ncbi:MAG: GNAT family N-acetyltransferase [Haloplanus sp.]